jgi:hypothetical protein
MQLDQEYTRLIACNAGDRCQWPTSLDRSSATPGGASSAARQESEAAPNVRMSLLPVCHQASDRRWPRQACPRPGTRYPPCVAKRFSPASGIVDNADGGTPENRPRRHVYRRLPWLPAPLTGIGRAAVQLGIRDELDGIRDELEQDRVSVRADTRRSDSRETWA